jgi:hypothetical protein
MGAALVSDPCERIPLGLEADAALRADPRLMDDPHRLGRIHAKLREALGETDARVALLQAGFIQGMRDARYAAESAMGPRLDATGDAVAAPRIAFDVVPQGRALDLAGVWHEKAEAEGLVAALGVRGAPACSVSCGYTAGWLSELMGEDLAVIETECAATGAVACRFRVRRVAEWLQRPEAAVAFTLAALDFGALGEASCALSATPPPLPDSPMDPALPVVHIWGPVMVLPYAGPDESMLALNLIAHDEFARCVSVVVIDLAGALLDPGVGAPGLEKVLCAVELRGADVVLAGVSPASRRALGPLEARHMLLDGELNEAIATAFRIADAQQRVY